jgi:hypothetical protein
MHGRRIGFNNAYFLNVTVDLDTAEDFLYYMNETYPLALAQLKKMCEG